MKELCGKMIKLLLTGGHKFRGMLISEDRIMAIVKSSEDTWRIPKAQIVAFTADKPEDDIKELVESNFVLGCRNARLECDGVTFIRSGTGISPADFARFMDPCPAKQGDCGCYTKGDVRSMRGDELKALLNGALFGEYPEVEGVEHGPDAKAASGKEKGKGVGRGKKQANGPARDTQDKAGGTGEQVPSTVQMQ